MGQDTRSSLPLAWSTQHLHVIHYTSLIVKLVWEVTWDLWDHHNQVKKNVETALDITHPDAVML